METFFFIGLEFIPAHTLSSKSFSYSHSVWTIVSAHAINFLLTCICNNIFAHCGNRRASRKKNQQQRKPFSFNNQKNLLCAAQLFYFASHTHTDCYSTVCCIMHCLFAVVEFFVVVVLFDVMNNLELVQLFFVCLQFYFFSRGFFLTSR